MSVIYKYLRNRKFKKQIKINKREIKLLESSLSAKNLTKTMKREKYFVIVLCCYLM